MLPCGIKAGHKGAYPAVGGHAADAARRVKDQGLRPAPGRRDGRAQAGGPGTHHNYIHIPENGQLLLKMNRHPKTSCF